jgi:hypothetical protein
MICIRSSEDRNWKSIRKGMLQAGKQGNRPQNSYNQWQSDMVAFYLRVTCDKQLGRDWSQEGFVSVSAGNVTSE